MVGDDGWGDGRLGRPYETPVRLNDFVLIEELCGLNREKLVMKLNQLGDDDWVPWFSCKAIGDALLDCAIENPMVDFLVVCGHTHGKGECTPRSNLKVMTGAAVYGDPRVSEVLEFPFS